MARFLIWMASFFSMAICWKYLGIAWSTRKDNNFLQVQNEHCKRLHNDILRLEKCLKDMEACAKEKVLNKNQCVHLFSKFILAMKGINKMLSSAIQDLKFQSIFEELYHLQKKVEIVGKNCTEQHQWCHLAIFQLQNKETFRELLLDLKCCYHSALDLYLLHHPNQPNNILPIQFDATTYQQVFEDGEVLKRKLELVLEGEVSEDYQIAQHLLLRLRNLDRVDGGNLDELEIPNDFNASKLINHIGAGVYTSNWLGLECATKVLRGGPELLINSRKELGILAGLNHPNLVQFVGCGTNKSVDEIVEEDEMVEIYLVMELMESSLSTMLRNEKGPLPYFLAIDIMHQIAKGVYYLHDMQVAHLDLKPDNILVNSISMMDLDLCYIFKLTDYGTSQLEVCSNPKPLKFSKPLKSPIGTRGYMSPEMIKGSNTSLYQFQADVWSFAMICSEILSRKIPYSGLKPKDFYNQISCTHGMGNKTIRPNLPNNCEELTNLIQECWSQDPLQRPTFFSICERLTSLKNSFLKGTYSCKMVPQYDSPCTLKDFEFILHNVPKVDEPIAPPKEILVDLHHQLSKAKRLLKLKYIGIVGMGGIGKTTLAKAILDDATLNSSYQASCFITECKNYQSSYEILCMIILKLGNDRKPKNFEEVLEMLGSLLSGKKVLIILDDIKDKAQVYDIAPLIIIKAALGSTIILTTRKWSTIESFVGIEGRLDVELLDDKVATTLFTTHLSWGVSPLPPDFEVLHKHVVKACNGLPLSLKVMGAFLRHKKRLRSWERALQRMARGRNLDGDEEIWNTLKISYDGLNDDEKRMFLDVACFFCKDVYPSGISKQTILYIWSKDGILPVSELERLIDMSLLKLSEDGDILEMHDQLRDMGRMLAKDTRIWNVSMIRESGFTSKDVEVLEGISWQKTMNHHFFSIKEDQRFEKLRVLILVSVLGNTQAHIDNFGIPLQIALQFSKLEAIIISPITTTLRQVLSSNASNTIYAKISNLCSTCASLKILDLIGLEFLEQLPNKFASSNTLLRLNLSSCCNLVTLPKEVGNFSSLTTLELRWCSCLVTLPKEVGNLSSLTILDMSGCLSLKALPKEVGNLSSLTTLNLSGCLSLVALPKEVGNLSSLTTLNLNGCSSLVTLPKEVGNLSSLTTLGLDRCSRLTSLPEEVKNLSSLTTLHLSGCSSLALLPKEVWNFSSLTTLDLGKCSSLTTFPKEIGTLSSLTTLDLRWCSSLVALPKEVGTLSSLTTLDLRWCSSLVALPKEVENLSFVTTLRLDGCSSLVVLPKELGNLSSLITLDLDRCSNLNALPKEIENLSSLATLHLGGCSNLVALPKEIGNLSSLTILDLGGCSSLIVLPNELGNLSSLTTIDLRWCSSLVALPKELGNLSSLTTIDLRWCSSLVALPKEVGNLSFLTTLDLDGCSSLSTLPKEVGNLSSLTTIDLDRCSSLATLPKEVGNLSSLSTLRLGGCSSLVALPKEIGKLFSLTTLGLNGCSSLKVLPKEVGNLSSLTTLDLEGCSSLAALPKEVENMFSLTILDLNGCSSLTILPKEVGNLSSFTTLRLRDCSSLATLPKEVQNLSSLITLDLDGCSSMTTLPKEVGTLSSLTTLGLGGCSSLVALPMEVGNLISLTTLDLDGCSSLTTLPKEVENLSSFTTLKLRNCFSLVTLPKELGNLSSLTIMDLDGCSSLATLPKEVENLSFLTTLYMGECSSLAVLPKEVGNLSSLTTLYLRGCSSLVTFPKEVENLSSLTTLDLGRCLSLMALPKEIGNLSSLTTLYLGGCSSLVTLPMEVGNLSSLTTLDLNGCLNLTTLPKEVGDLSSLTTLNLGGCSSLTILPREVENLLSLITLHLGGCSSLVALEIELENLSSLTTLGLDGCSSLTTLPKEVGNLSSLVTLDLGGCSSLTTLPKEVENLSSLMTLRLDGCSSLMALEIELGNLSSLTTLDLDGCSSLLALPKKAKNLPFN